MKQIQEILSLMASNNSYGWSYFDSDKGRLACFYSGDSEIIITEKCSKKIEEVYNLLREAEKLNNIN